MGGLQIDLCAQELVCNVESDTIELRPMPKCKDVMSKRVSSELREVAILLILEGMINFVMLLERLIGSMQQFIWR